MPSLVATVAAAPPDQALARFEGSLAFETDCWDVQESFRLAAAAGEKPDFVLVDVRGPASYAAGHVPGAINIPHGKMTASRMTEFPPDTLFITYCNGPHCNGATRGAIRLARLGRPVKIMIGGITGWLDEGFSLVTA